MVLDTHKNRLATKEKIRGCLYDNGVTLTPQEFEVMFDQVAQGQAQLNYLDFIAACRGQMSPAREAAVSGLFSRIEPRKNAEAKTSAILTRFRAEKHPDVKSLGFDPKQVRANFEDMLTLFGKLGGFDLQNGLMRFDEFLEFFDGVSALETDDRRFMSILNDCFA